MRDRVGGIWRWFHAPRFEAQFEHGPECIQADSLGYVIEKQNPKMPSQRNCRLRGQPLDYPRKATDATCKRARTPVLHCRIALEGTILQRMCQPFSDVFSE